MDIEKDTLQIILLSLFLIYTISLYIRYNLPGSSHIKNTFGKYFLYSNLNPIYKPYLIQYFPAYNKLDEIARIQFERRVQKFINMKTFVPRGEIKKITPEMKALIAGSVVQITMGYPDVYFSHFRTIIVYPDKYYSRITGKYHNGEVNKLGVIVLSWKCFMEGFRIPRDGVNLGYHEMAHALRLEDIVSNNDYNFLDSSIVKKFENEAIIEMKKVKENHDGSSFFNDYSATNLHEFFAVAIESFIERPMEFRAYNKNLYSYLSKILNFDLLEAPYEGKSFT